MTKNFKIVFVTIFTATLAVAVYVFFSVGKENPTTQESPNSNASLSNFYECSDSNVKVSLESLDCVRESLEDIAISGDVTMSLSLLEELVSKDPAYTAACHGWAHSIGFASAKSTPMDDLFSITWDKCTYGFYHGVQSFYLGSMDSLNDVQVFYDKVCTPAPNFPDKDRFSIECAHLVGHFIADLSTSRLNTGFDACFNIVSNNGASGSCIDGLIMRFAEFVDLENGGTETFAEQSFDVSSFDSVSFFGGELPEALNFLYLVCSDLPISSESTCAKRMPILVFRLAERDMIDASLYDKWKVVHSFCESFNSSIIDQCFEGVGVAALNMSGWAPDVLVEACTAGDSGEGAASCIKAVALAFAYNNPSSSAMNAFCQFTPPALLEPCIQGFNSGL